MTAHRATTITRLIPDWPLLVRMREWELARQQRWLDRQLTRAGEQERR